MIKAEVLKYVVVKVTKEEKAYRVPKARLPRKPKYLYETSSIEKD